MKVTFGSYSHLNGEEVNKIDNKIKKNVLFQLDQKMSGYVFEEKFHKTIDWRKQQRKEDNSGMFKRFQRGVVT